MRTKSEILDHLAEACLGHGGNPTGSELRILDLADRLRELQQAEENFGVPLPTDSSGGPTDPGAIRIIQRWRYQERSARRENNAAFFKDVARACEHLKKEAQMPVPDANASEAVVRRLTAGVALGMIRSREKLPFRHEVIDVVEHQLANYKFWRSPIILSAMGPGATGGLSAVEKERRLLQKKRVRKELNWRRILRQLWLFDFLPTR